MLRGVRLGAFLVPLVVAIVPVGVLVWYGLVHIPAQESYLNERNLRLLMTLSGNIKTKVDNFDNAIDHAVTSFGTDQAQLRDRVHMFAPELDIVGVRLTPPPKPGPGADIVDVMLSDAADPPRIRVDRDEGRSFMYLGARISLDGHGTAWIVATTDIEKVVAPFLSTRGEFDALLLVAQSGEVIVQRSPIGLAMTRVNSVLDARAAAPADKSGAAPASFDKARHFSNMIPVRIGEADYKLYMQPVPLSLLAADERHPDQWVLCGLVRADRFRRESSSLSVGALLWFSAALAAVFLAIPFVKLKAIRPRERLRAVDARWLAAATFAAVGLIAIGGLDIAVFGYAFPRTIDDRLSTVADEITAHMRSELEQIDQEAQVLDARNDGTFSRVSQDLHKAGRDFPQLLVSRKTDVLVSCEPTPACETDILRQWDGNEREHPYPYVYLVTWIGGDGWQRIKQTPGRGLTPFINLRDTGVTYYDEVQRAWRRPQSGTPARGVSVLASPNTGEPLTVFWRAGRSSDAHINYSQSLAIFSPISLDRPPLPKGVSFAVVNRDGRTIFHSDPTRSLQENFLKECGDDPLLRASLGAPEAPPLSTYYRGQLNRLHVSPLTMGAFGDPHWSLVVFQDSAAAQTVNLETVTLACMVFAAYGVLLALGASILQVAAPAPPNWFWPAGGNEVLYRRLACGLLASAAVLGAVQLWLPPGAALLCIAATAAAALFLTRMAVVRSRSSDAPTALGLAHPFFAARAALLLVVAGMPAVACFEAAYAFETRLLATSELVQAHKDGAARADRIERFVGRFNLPQTSTLPFTQRREAASWDRVEAPLWPQSSGAGAQLLDASLAGLHRSYNDLAIDLKWAAASNVLVPHATSALNAGSLALIVIGLFGVSFTFVFALTKPLFVLDAVAPKAADIEAAAHAARCLLIVGPPGSGKSTTLAEYRNIRVFDVTSLTFIERRRRAQPVPIERRRAVVAAAGIGGWAGRLAFDIGGDAHAAPAATSAANWADTFDYSTLSADPDAVLGIDHLDHRLEDCEFAAQTLRFLEHVVHRGTGLLRVVCDRDPIVCLKTCGASTADLDRWTRVLSSFRKEVVAVREKPAAESADDAFAPYHQALWHACTSDERVALYQLAQEGLINPQNQDVARQLVRVGLIVRDPVPRIVSDGFQRFVLQAASVDEVSAWERRGVPVPWGSIEFAMMTVVVGLAGLLVITQEQFVSAWVGFVPTLLPTAQRLWSTIAAVRGPDKGTVA